MVHRNILEALFSNDRQLGATEEFSLFDTCLWFFLGGSRLGIHFSHYLGNVL